MGAAAADYDNDGHTDLFVAGVNRNTLYHNLGNGHFEDVTAKAGITSGEWAVAAGWFDYDRDGQLDLWVVHYAKWSPAYDRYCGDAVARASASTAIRNISRASPARSTAIAATARSRTSRRAPASRNMPGRGMSVAFADYDQDGWPDAFVTNDNMPNFLFHNRGNGTFEEVALLAGVALRDHGKPVASMGTEFKDYDNDGLPDIFVTALAGETFPAVPQRREGQFRRRHVRSRAWARSRVKHSGWGLGRLRLQ